MRSIGIRRVHGLVVERQIPTHERDPPVLGGFKLAARADRCSCGFAGPSYAPDGRRIVLEHCCDNVGNGDALFVMNADGTSLRHLTEEPPRRRQEGGSDQTPQLSPNGRTILFTHCAPDCQNATINIHGGNLRLVSDASVGAEHANWSPDGTRIVFRITVDDTFNIATSRPDGSDFRQVTFDTADTGANAGPAFSPDGALIIFVHRPGAGGSRDIYVMDPDGGNLRQITHRRAGVHAGVERGKLRISAARAALIRRA